MSLAPPGKTCTLKDAAGSQPAEGRKKSNTMEQSLWDKLLLVEPLKIIEANNSNPKAQRGHFMLLRLRRPNQQTLLTESKESIKSRIKHFHQCIDPLLNFAAKKSRYWLTLIFAVCVCIKIQFVLQDCAQIFIRLYCSPWLPFNHTGCRRAPSVIKHFFGFGHNLSEGRTGHTRWQMITSFSVLVKLTWVARQMVESKCENLVLGPKVFFFSSPFCYFQ